MKNSQRFSITSNKDSIRDDGVYFSTVCSKLDAIRSSKGHSTYQKFSQVLNANALPFTFFDRPNDS